MISGPSDVKDVSDLVLGSFEDNIRFVSSYSKTVEEVRLGLTPIEYDKFKEETSKSFRAEGTKFNDKQCEKSYKLYVAELKESLDDELSELKSQLEWIKNPFTKRKVGRHGYFDFAMCQYDTEGEARTLQPYEWRAKLVDGHGKILSLAYGTLYVAADGCQPDAQEMPYLADIYTSQELSVVSKYFDHIEEELEDEEEPIFDPFDIVQTEIENGGIVLLQYLKRDVTRPELKGVGFETFKYAIDCIQGHFSDSIESLSFGIFHDIYKNVDTSYTQEFSETLANAFSEYFSKNVENWSSVTYLSYWD